MDTPAFGGAKANPKPQAKITNATMDHLMAYVQIEWLDSTFPCPTIKRAIHYAQKHGTDEFPCRVWKPIWGTGEMELEYEYPESRDG